jgi:hypothetical protein
MEISLTAASLIMSVIKVSIYTRTVMCILASGEMTLNMVLGYSN